MPNRFFIESVMPAAVACSFILHSDTRTSVSAYEWFTSRYEKRRPPSGTGSRAYCAPKPRFRVFSNSTPAIACSARTSHPAAATTSSSGSATPCDSTKRIRRAPCSERIWASASAVSPWVT